MRDARLTEANTSGGIRTWTCSSAAKINGAMMQIDVLTFSGADAEPELVPYAESASPESASSRLPSPR